MAGLIASVTTNAFGNALILPNEHEIIKRAQASAPRHRIRTGGGRTAT
jgi:hypothetical protein